MNFLINSSNAKGGGGIQVTDSICCLLDHYSQHHFVVVLSSYFNQTKKRIANVNNITLIEYNTSNGFLTLLCGRDRFLDNIVIEYRIDAVLTVFGPSRWQPRSPHLCGFARSHLVLPDSPFFEHITLKQRLRYMIWKYYFKRSSRVFYTENPYITARFQKLMGGRVTVHTVTNYYNQVYDHPEKWGHGFVLPVFDGTTLLTISSWNEHKNFPIMVGICRYMKDYHPDFRFRFVLTIPKEKRNFIPEEYSSYFHVLGPVDVSECPYLYEQADIMFMPTLLECFSATYPEAMRMGKPIVTTDLEFARGLCGDAACYYDAINPEAAAEAIFRVATDKNYAMQLVSAGKIQLNNFDDYNQRTKKLISLLEEIAVTEVGHAN